MTECEGEIYTSQLKYIDRLLSFYKKNAKKVFMDQQSLSIIKRMKGNKTKSSSTWDLINKYITNIISQINSLAKNPIN